MEFSENIEERAVRFSFGVIDLMREHGVEIWPLGGQMTFMLRVDEADYSPISLTGIKERYDKSSGAERSTPCN